MCFWSWHVAPTHILAVIINRILSTCQVPGIGLRGYFEITPHGVLTFPFCVWGKKRIHDERGTLTWPQLHSCQVQAVWLPIFQGWSWPLTLPPALISAEPKTTERPSRRPERLSCPFAGDFSPSLGKSLGISSLFLPFYYLLLMTTLLETKEKYLPGRGDGTFASFYS